MDFAIFCIFQHAILWIFALQLSAFLFYTKQGMDEVIAERTFQLEELKKLQIADSGICFPL